MNTTDFVPHASAKWGYRGYEARLNPIMGVSHDRTIERRIQMMEKVPMVELSIAAH